VVYFGDLSERELVRGAGSRMLARVVASIGLETEPVESL